jgi:hypothetical protein
MSIRCKAPRLDDLFGLFERHGVDPADFPLSPDGCGLLSWKVPPAEVVAWDATAVFNDAKLAIFFRQVINPLSANPSMGTDLSRPALTLVLRAVGVRSKHHSGTHFREQEAPVRALPYHVQSMSRNVPKARKAHRRLGIDIQVLCHSFGADEAFLIGHFKSAAGRAVRPPKPVCSIDQAAFLALRV